MLTFFEFYEVLLGFVLYKLYNDIGVRYPFTLSKEKERQASSQLASYLYTLNRALREGEGAVSSAVSEAVETSTGITDKASNKSKQKNDSNDIVKKVDAALHKIKNDDSSDDEDDGSDDEGENMDISEPLKAALDNLAEEQHQSITSNSNGGVKNSLLSEDATKRKRLFSKLTFFLSREVPRGYLELICLSYGGKVGWEGEDSPISIKDPTITHHIVDRPKLPSSFDSLPKSREYVQPQWLLDCANNEFLLPCSKYGVGSELPPHLSPWVDNEEEGYKPAYAEEIEKLKSGETLEENSDVESDAEKVDSGSDEEKSDAEGEDSDEEDQDVEEARKAKKRKKEEDEAHNLAKLMMSKKASRLYGRMQHGLSQKQEKIDLLQRRREEIELEKLDKLQRKREDIDISVKGKNPEGETPMQQKVKRLKSERKAIEDVYSEDKVSMKKKKNKKRKKSSASE